jgi:ubiquinone/menaquinone biosynthesis C-methylase UbiE
MIDHFGLLAPLYDRIIKPPDPQWLADLLQLPIDGALLDVGGGTGRVIQQFQGQAGFMVISDESPDMLRQAREKGFTATVSAGAERLPFAANMFQRVLVVDALHHFADQRQAIAEFVRVLRPGGRLVIEEPDLNRFSVKLIAIAEKVALMRSRFYYPQDIAQMVAANGLQPQVHKSDRFAAWVTADKSPEQSADNQGNKSRRRNV